MNDNSFISKPHGIILEGYKQFQESLETGVQTVRRLDKKKVAFIGGGVLVAAAVAVVVKNPALAVKAGTAVAKGATVAKTTVMAPAFRQGAVTIAKQTVVSHAATSGVVGTIATAIDVAVDRRLGDKVSAKEVGKKWLHHSVGVATNPYIIAISFGGGVGHVFAKTGAAIEWGTLGVFATNTVVKYRKATKVITDDDLSKLRDKLTGVTKSDPKEDAYDKYVWSALNELGAQEFSEKFAKDRELAKATSGDIQKLAAFYAFNNADKSIRPGTLRKQIEADFEPFTEEDERKFVEEFTNYAAEAHNFNRKRHSSKK